MTTIDRTKTRTRTAQSRQRKSTIKDEKIIPFLWFNNNAEEAVNFYISTFKNSKILGVSRYGDAGPGPKGSVMSVTFRLEGQNFYALNGGPEFSFTPATSFYVNCKTSNEINALWKNLSQGGTVLMELAKYPFSEKYGWIQDKFGVSWQLILSNDIQKIAPFLMFAGKHQGQTEQAINFYVSLFKNSKIINIMRYTENDVGETGSVIHASFKLNGQIFMAMDSAIKQDYSFTQAISYFVNCKTQREVDEFWDKLSEGGEIQQCGWLIDKFGVCWQIVPVVLGEMLNDPDQEKVNRVMNAMMKMVKLDIKTLKNAYNLHNSN